MQESLPQNESDRITSFYKQMSSQIKQVCGQEQAGDESELKRLLLLGMIKEQ